MQAVPTGSSRTVARRPPAGWKLELFMSLVFLALTAMWIVVFAQDAQADTYQGSYHPAAESEVVIRKKGMVLHRIIDGPVRCYIVVTEARMIGFQSSISCVIPDKEKRNESPEPKAGR